MTDPIADMLTRFRNVLVLNKKEAVFPMSKVKHEIAKILENERYLEKVEILKGDKEKEGDERFDRLRVVFNYKKNKLPSIQSLKRISKPGLRIYAKKDELPRVLNGLGIAIISTPSGLMTNKEAKKKGVGGEVICEIY